MIFLESVERPALFLCADLGERDVVVKLVRTGDVF